MPGNRESSVWRTLAVAFGDGLAFGVGLTLTNNAARPVTSKTSHSQPDLHQLADRISQIEQRIDRGRFAGALPAPAGGTQQIAKVADAVLTAMDGRFGELGEQFERRLAALDARLKFELEALDARVRVEAESIEAGVDVQLGDVRREFTAALEGQRVRLEADGRVLRGQMLQVHKEFAETLARLVDEQIEKTISARLQVIQEQTRESVREESLTMEKLIEMRLESWREERGSTDRQFAELRSRLEGQEDGFQNLVAALRQSWMQAADRIGVPAAPYRTVNGNGGGGSSSGTHITKAVDTELPGFARQSSPRRLWHIPAVSCFLLATTGLLALHFLVV